MCTNLIDRPAGINVIFQANQPATLISSGLAHAVDCSNCLPQEDNEQFKMMTASSLFPTSRRRWLIFLWNYSSDYVNIFIRNWANSCIHKCYYSSSQYLYLYYTPRYALIQYNPSICWLSNQQHNRDNMNCPSIVFVSSFNKQLHECETIGASLLQ
jgi:hypothetical protein